MNLRSFDLNLLVILDALLDEQHVSRAADRVGLSQPAASAALQRCRDVFRDDLLLRGRGVMHLTPRAEALRAPLKGLLAEVERLIDPPRVPLGELQQTVRLVTADYAAALIVPGLQAALAHSAPGIDLVVSPFLGPDAVATALLAGTTDIAFSPLPGLEDELHREDVLEEHFVVAMRRGHPAEAGFGLEAWLAFPHLVVSGRGEQRGGIDALLAERGLRRRVGLVLPSFQAVSTLLLGSDLLALMPSRCVAAESGLAIYPPPVPVKGFTVHLAWLRRRRDDQALRHVAGLISGLVRQSSEGRAGEVG